MKRNNIIFSFMFLVISLSMMPSATRAQADPLVWARVGGVPPTVALVDVEMLDPNTAWAVGNDGSAGYIYRLAWRDSRWNVSEDARFTAPLLALDAIDATNAWAVGEHGLIVRHTADGWRAMPTIDQRTTFAAIHMLGADDGWAGGSVQSGGGTQAVLYHYGSGAWVRDTNLPTVGTQSSIAAIDFTNGTGWALFNSNEYRLEGDKAFQLNATWRYADGRWTAQPAPDPCQGLVGCGTSLTDIAALSDGRAWGSANSRASCSFCPTNPIASVFTNQGWQSAVLPDLYDDAQPYGTSLRGVDFLDADHGLFAGTTSYSHDGQDFEEGIVLRNVMGQWSRETLPRDSIGLNAISQTDVRHALAVGEQGRILSYGYGPTALSTPPAPPRGTFAAPAFEQVWQRTDLPVASNPAGLRPRTWLWGPSPITDAYTEPYAEAPNGTRAVQYFDKSRMEITHPDAARDQWYVTNGLLAVELITGRVQVGDNAFEERPAAYEAVAGDRIEINPNAPTYASLINVAYPNACEPCRDVPRASGQTVTATFSNNAVGADPALARYGVTVDGYDAQLGHNIPKVFTNFFGSQALVYQNGRYEQGQLFDWVFVMGLPISEPYWTRVKVGGVEKDVLFQAFERRVLTYTPDNAPEWRVEMGNVGQHYLRWRHGQ